MGWINKLFYRDRHRMRSLTHYVQPFFPNDRQRPLAPNPSNVYMQSDFIPPERIGLQGEYDQNGLAKRVMLAFSANALLSNSKPLHIAQTGGIVVIKGEVPDSETLGQMIIIARKVKGTTAIDTSQVSIH